MIELGRWVVAGLAALGAGAAAALISQRRPDDNRPHGADPEAPPPSSGGAVNEQQAALDEARERLRRRADEVRAQLEREPD